MGVATGCGFKEIYRFPHTTYPYSSCICPFLQQHPYFFCSFFLMFCVLVYIYRLYCAVYGVQYVVYIYRERERETVLCSMWCPVCYIYIYIII